MPKDLFSNHAKEYATYRPVYPQALYDFIYQHVKKFDQAWDCGTGNGQVASVLATKFQSVHATDISAKQIENAHKRDNIYYSIARTENGIYDESRFDLITVGQAIHWFELDNFYNQVRRAGKKDSVLAVFGYSPVQFSSEFDKALNQFYYNKIYPYWETERRVVEDRYGSLYFPFEEIATPHFKMPLLWSLHDVYGYISTWSAVQKYIRQNGHNPVDEFIENIKHLWKSEKESVHFPVFMKMGRIK